MKYICQSDWCYNYNKEISGYEIYITDNRLEQIKYSLYGQMVRTRTVVRCIKCGQEVKYE